MDIFSAVVNLCTNNSETQQREIGQVISEAKGKKAQLFPLQKSVRRLAHIVFGGKKRIYM